MSTRTYLQYFYSLKKYFKNKNKDERHAIYNLIPTRNSNNEVCIMITDLDNTTYEILIDEEDYHRILCCDLIYVYLNYAYVVKYNKVFSMHQFVTNYEGPLYIDHMYRNTYDNRKKHLRFVTPSENMYNTVRGRGESGYKGVCSTSSNKWQDHINFNKQYIYIGTYEDKDEAARVRDLYTLKYHADHLSELNFPDNIDLYKANLDEPMFTEFILKNRSGNAIEVKCPTVAIKQELVSGPNIAFNLYEQKIKYDFYGIRMHD